MTSKTHVAAPEAQQLDEPRSPQPRSRRRELRPIKAIQAKGTERGARGARERTRAGRGRLFTRPRALAWSALVAALPLVLASTPVISAAAEPTRSEYVAHLEQICKPGSEATQRAVHGVRHDVRSERLAVAATKFSRAKRIFAHTVGAISTVPRPAADAGTLARWFADLNREEGYLGRIVATLRASNVARFQRVSAQFIHEGNRANDVVVSYGFNYCSFKPSRFQ
jgi:hypothetical protein